MNPILDGGKRVSNNAAADPIVKSVQIYTIETN